ncbi:MAG: LysR family transcriptional regulator [Kordiimonadaceae bacterium]|nr:LysR family transcriptional regulator [Kordiimonadaceae bacterium]
MSQNWDGVAEFVCVVEEGSFSLAASRLGVSRSHVSKKVKQLETRMGISLLHRTTRSLNLTSLGAEFFPKCKHLLSEMDEAQALVMDGAAKAQGTIRLTVSGVFGEEMLAPMLAEFAAKHPDISIDVEFTNRVVNLEEERFDIGFRSGISAEIRAQNDVAEQLYNYELLTVASRSYLSDNAPIGGVVDLQDHNCLNGSLPHWRFIVDGQVQNTVVRGKWRSNNGKALVQGALNHLGIIQVPHFYVEEAIKRGALVALLEAHQVQGLGYFAVLPSAHPPRRVAVLLEHLRESFKLTLNPIP